MSDSETDPFVHPTAVVESGAEVGAGTRIWHYCHVMSGAFIGRDVVLGQNGFVAKGAVIGDGCRIQNNVSLFDGVILGRRVFVGPSAVFTNVRRPRAGTPRKDSFEATRIGDDATIGANATIVCGVAIGEGAMVGAGAVVTRDVAPFRLVTGNPARVTGYVCRCGEALSDATGSGRSSSGRCSACGRSWSFESADDIVVD